MDAGGMTLASSNRFDPDSFMGRSYDFRPYFQEAVKGQVGRYFAIGVTSGKRGFYASYPVRNPSGEVIGVVTMKKDMDGMESYFSKYPLCFLISPDGIIFLSSKPAMVAKSLWPLEKTVRERLIASRQFGNNFAAGLIKKEIADGMDVSLGNNNYFVSREAIDKDGWSIMLLTPTDRIGLYRWIGVLATLSVSIVMMVFSAVIYATNRSKEVFRQSEENKRLLLHAAGDGIFGVDTSGNVTFVNPAALRMLGFIEEELLCRNVHSLVHHSRKDGSKYPLEDCPMCTSYTLTKDSHVADEVLWRKDGSSFSVEYSSMPITKDGNVAGAVVSFTDCTERKRAEAALQEITQRLKLAASSAKLGIWDWDLTSNNMVWDDRMLELYGLTRETFPGGIEAWQNGLHLEDRDKTIEECQAALRGEKEWDTDFRVLHPDGTIKRIKANGMVIRNVVGTPVRMLGINFDITERKQAEDALLNEKKFSEAIIESIPGMLYVYDDQGNHIRHNKRHEDMTGYSDEELSRLNPLSWYDDKADIIRVEAAIGDVFTKGYGEVEAPVRIKSGEKLMMHFTGSRLVMNGKKYFVGVGTDITERKRIEEDLLRLNKTLELRVSQEVKKNLKHELLLIQQSRLAAMGEMIGNIAHQWRQPLNALGLLLFNIKDAYQFNSLDADYLDQAVEGGSRMVQKMSTTISDFSNFFRPNKESSVFSALVQIREAATLMESSFQSSNISIHIDAPNDIMMLGFPNEYSQVLLNLLSNAKDAILARKSTLAGRVDIFLAEIDGEGCVSVRDNGGGIPEAILDKIFDPYFTTKEKGSGIGLYMSKMIIERNMNGRITVKNIEAGTEFNVCAPLAKDSPS
jgi:PAS domain S-box-containing protein